MKCALLLVYFALFGFGWPVLLANKARGRLMLAAMLAPWLAFGLGWLAR